MSRKVLSRGEIIILAIVGLILLAFAMQKCGIDVAATSEESEIIDKPHTQ